MNHKHAIALLVLACTILSGCDRADRSGVARKPNRVSGSADDPVVNVDSGDNAMNAAMETAKESFHLFEKNWKTIQCDSVSIKFAIPTDDDGLEHIWFEPVEIAGDQIVAICGNDPEKVSNLKLGDKRTLNKDDISDWMILDGSKCYGGYTIQVLSRMQPKLAPPFKFAELK